MRWLTLVYAAPVADLGLLLRDRVKVNQSILSRLSSIQLRLFAKMYISLRRSSQISRLIPPHHKTLERQGDTIELVAGAPAWYRMAPVHPVPASFCSQPCRPWVRMLGDEGPGSNECNLPLFISCQVMTGRVP